VSTLYIHILSISINNFPHRTLSSQFLLKIKSATRSLKFQNRRADISHRSADETRVTHGGLIYRITDSRDRSSKLSGGSKVSKEIFLPSPSVLLLPTRGGIYPENISFHLKCSVPRESPTLRIESSSTSSKLWTLSSDTRDSQFDLTRKQASMQGAEAEGN